MSIPILCLSFVLGLPSFSQQTSAAKKKKESHSVVSIQQSPANATTAVLPQINVDLPMRVKLGQAFKMDVWLDPPQDGNMQLRTVYMEQTDAIRYEPRVFEVRPDQRQTVSVTILNSRSGLADIWVLCDGYPDFDVVIDAGFSAKLRPSAEGNFESERTYDVSLNIVDEHGVAVPLDAPVTLELKTSNAQLWYDGKWIETATLQLAAGVTSTGMIRVRPSSIVGQPVSLSAVMSLDREEVVHSEFISIPVLPAWWFMLLMAICGGVLPVVYRVLQDLTQIARPRHISWVKVIARVAIGALSGTVAYFFADFDVIGVKLDVSSPRTFVILGFLFSYIGLDLVMKRFAPKDHSPTTQSA